MKATAESLAPADVEQAGAIMTTDLLSAAPGDTIAAVGALMRDVLGVLLDAVDQG